MISGPFIDSGLFYECGDGGDEGMMVNPWVL
jgi:hypothetical protein